MLELYQKFIALPSAETVTEFTAICLSQSRKDFLAKGMDGAPVFLLQDASPVRYVVGRRLRHLSVEFHTTCRVQIDTTIISDQFAILACDSTSPELYELFIRCVGAAIEGLPADCGTKELEGCVDTLLDLFRGLSESSAREVSGLWAELWVIARSNNTVRALEVWHDNVFERFDFSWDLVCVEVKSTVRDIRQHEFALEQLNVPLNGQGYVISLMLQQLTGGVSILELAKEIEANLFTVPHLKTKLWKGIAKALGKDFSDKLDKKFDPSFAERNLVVYNMVDMPKVAKPDDLRISAVRFAIDLSTVNSSIEGVPMSNLKMIFRVA